MNSEHKRKILVIPSWYPTAHHPLTGSFFREQADLLNGIFDVRVLYGVKESLSRGKYIKALLGNVITSGSLFCIKQGMLITPPTGIGFSFFGDWPLGERVKLKVLIGCYEKGLRFLMDRKWKPDLIHAQSTVYGGIVASQLGSKYKIPVMITEHQKFLLNNYSVFLQKEIFSALEKAEIVSTVSMDKMKIILMHGIKCDPVVVGNMVDERRFQGELRKNHHKPFRILVVASNSFIKDLYTFFRAIKNLVDRHHDDFRATIIGLGVWGDLRSEYKEFAKSLGLENKCEFIDVVSRDNMSAHYNECDVFVSTSIAETFQISILEALACGKFVVSTANGGAEEMITPENGILTKIRDHHAIADAIIKVKTGAVSYDPQKIRADAVTRFGREVFTDRIAKLYEEAINKGNIKRRSIA